MRLIDTNMLLKKLEWLDEYDFIVFKDVKKTIDETPTVKAIPKEWIRDYMRRLPNGSEAYECILVMLEEWGKENETNRR